MDILKFIKKSSQKVGMKPGSVVYIGKKQTSKVTYEILDYTWEKVTEKSLIKIEEAFPFKDLPSVTWLNVNGIHDVKVIEKIGHYFDLHPLMQEDIANTGQRPTLDDYDTYLFVVLKMLYFGKDNELHSENISLVIGKSFVISFQENKGDVFDPLRERINAPKWRARKLGSDYLGYAIMDSIVDHYFIVLEKIGEKMADLEEELNLNPAPETQRKINELKREMIFLRKSIWPLREVIGKLQKSESEIISKQTKLYLSDLYDHTIQVIDTIESFRDILSGMTDVYLSSISNRMNEVMKTLSIIATIALPLTVVSGIYGTNFTNLPGAAIYSGFWLMIILMVLMIAIMLYYFRKKNWF